MATRTDVVRRYGRIAALLTLPALPMWPARALDLGFDGPYIEYGEQAGGETQFAALGGWAGFNAGFFGRMGVAYVHGDEHELVALDLALARYLYTDGVNSYVGYGLLAGYNDDSGHPMAALYPEIGLLFRPNGRWRFAVTGKYFFSSEGGDNHFGILSGHLQWLFDAPSGTSN
jgi:hypothetical protein